MTATNAHPAIEELFVASFSMQYQGKAGSTFFPERPYRFRNKDTYIIT
jgi:hypothetical protein